MIQASTCVVIWPRANPWSCSASGRDRIVDSVRQARRWPPPYLIEVVTPDGRDTWCRRADRLAGTTTDCSRESARSQESS
jgi:hypothetical protein